MHAEPEPEPPRVVEPTAFDDGVDLDAIETAHLDGVTRRGGFDDEEPAADTSTPVDGLVTTSFDGADAPGSPPSLLDLEPTVLPGAEEAMVEGAAADEGESPASGDDLELMRSDDVLSPPASATPSHTSPTQGLPLMDVESNDRGAAPYEPGEPDEPDAAEAPASTVGRASTMLAARSVEMLQAVVEGNPADWGAHRELGEAMFEAGHRDAGRLEFETAMKGYESDGNLEAAASIADELVRTDPSSVKYHQKRVEYAFRSNDKHRLVDAYLELADALFRSDQADKARVIYHRVLELAPDHPRAQGALSALAETPSAGMSGSSLGTPSRPRMSIPTPVRGQFVNLGDLMRDEERPKDTRMVVAEQEPTGDEEADFADMLRKFKQGVADNVDEEDYQSHYDLGIAYKEMGLLDEAISEFQKSLRGVDNRVRTYEAIGQCFMEKEQFQMASTLLARALHEKGAGDDKLVGVLYLLGRACEALGRPEDALVYYQRVYVVDVQFRDVGDRMNAIEQAAR